MRPIEHALAQYDHLVAKLQLIAGVTRKEALKLIERRAAELPPSFMLREVIEDLVRRYSSGELP